MMRLIFSADEVYFVGIGTMLRPYSGKFQDEYPAVQEPKFMHMSAIGLDISGCLLLELQDAFFETSMI